MSKRNRSGLSLAWAKVNAYGILFVGLLLMSVLGLLHPETSTAARVLGYVPGAFYFWTPALFLSGALLLTGFLTASARAEMLGLGIMVVAMTFQTVYLVFPDPLGGDALQRYAVWLLVAGVAWMRTSVLRSKDGLRVTIPGRD